MSINGKAIAADIFQTLQADVSLLKEKNINPHLVVMLIGNDPASVAYVNQKKKRGEEIGITVSVVNYATSVTTGEVLNAIHHLNKDTTVHGIIVQQPVPNHIDIALITDMTNPHKDVDGFHKDSVFTPPIAEAAMAMLENTKQTKEEFKVWLKSKNIVVIGKGETGGTPVANKLKTYHVSPIIIDSKTINPEALTKKADIIISCVGRANIITKNMLKKGVILLSIGMFRGEDGKLHGDYEEEDIKDIASYYSPVPGGVGPVNVAMLLANVVTASKRNAKHD